MRQASNRSSQQDLVLLALVVAFRIDAAMPAIAALRFGNLEELIIVVERDGDSAMPAASAPN
jgi:hypothetical protein